LPSASATPRATATIPSSATPTPEYAFHVCLPLVVRNSCENKRQYADWVLIIDTSTSMLRDTGAGRSKLSAAQEAASVFVSQLALEPEGRGGHDRVAIVGFNGEAWSAQPLTNDSDQAAAALENLAGRVAGGSRLDLALEEGMRALDSGETREANDPVLIVMTDGMANLVPTSTPSGSQAQTVLSVAQEARARGIRVFTIGVGTRDAADPAARIDADLLRAVATDPTDYFETPSAEDLERIYAEITMRFRCPR